MRKFLILLLFSAFLLVSCSNSVNLDESNNKDNLDFWHITDIHYLSESLNVNSPDFTAMMLESDGKMTHYSHDMFSAFKDSAINENPDVILITGDLTFNGEKNSHLDFANLLTEIEKEGITVLTIPGNHDINYPFAYSFIDNTATLCDNISYEEFENIYNDFGLGDAILRDANSLSYIYKYNSDVYFLGIDTSSSGNGVLLNETLDWLDNSLDSLPEDSTIISLTHQNIFIHNEGFEHGFVIDKHIELCEILKKYNVELNLSGHMHIQNIHTEDNLTDIATSAYSLFTTRYAIIQYNNGNLQYSSHSIDVEEWANKNNSTNQDLLNFNDYSIDFYYQTAYSQGLNSASNFNLTKDESHLVADFIAQMNTHYFYGSLKDNIDDLKSHSGYLILSQTQEDSFMKDYINTVLNSPINDDLNWSN